MRGTIDAEATEFAVEAKEKSQAVALIIAVLALMLALAEAGAKNAQHLSTEKNIKSSDLFNFYQAKRFARRSWKPRRPRWKRKKAR